MLGENFLKMILIGIMGVAVGMLLADWETRDEVIHERIEIMEDRLQGKLLPSVIVNSPRTTIYGGGGQVLIMEEDN